MKLVNRVGLGVLGILALGTVLDPAAAETQLTDFNGSWQGTGVDRNMPFQSMQRTSCQATINADLHHMKTAIVCNGVAGLTKVIQLNITLAGGEAFSGDLTQKATTRGDSSSETVLKGSVSGNKTDKSANFRVSFPGLTPSVDVALGLNNPSSFSMQATTFGGQLMNVSFNRTSKP